MSIPNSSPMWRAKIQCEAPVSSFALQLARAWLTLKVVPTVMLGCPAELLKQQANQKSKNPAEWKKLYEALQEVDSDLTVKAKHIKGGRGGGATLVQVLVRSKKDAQDVAGYEVWYVPKGWAADSSTFKRFDGLTDASNPPQMNLAPGNYFLWLSKGQPIPGRQPISLGGDGKTKREIDLVVP